MTTKALNYPHPVLDNINDDFPGCSFNIDFIESESTRDSLTLKMRAVLDCSSIKAEINKGQAKPIIRIRCPKTAYREIRPIPPSGEFEIELEKKQLAGTLELEALIVTTKQINQYILPDFNQSYFANVSFKMRKGDILAVAPSLKMKLHSPKKRNMAGIVRIRKAENNIKEPKVHYAAVQDEETEQGDYIYITLPKEEFESYGALRKKKYLYQGSERFLQSAIVLPALTEAISLLREEERWEKESDEKTYRGTMWADSTYEALERHGIESLGEEPASNYEIANKILENVTRDAISELLQKLEECATSSYGDDDL